MFKRDIQSELEELYGIDASPSIICKITNKVMDAVHFKVREEHRIVSKAAYICTSS